MQRTGTAVAADPMCLNEALDALYVPGRATLDVAERTGIDHRVATIRS
jgi:hypothetical protein